VRCINRDENFMALTPSQKPTRELPLLVLTLGLVGIICFPLWQGFTADGGNPLGGWSAERWSRLLLGPEQIACYVFFTWAGFILLSRYWEVCRQRRAFALGLLPTEEGTRILQEDARPLKRKVDEVTALRGPFILSNMIRAALGKFAVSRSSQDVSEAVRMQAEVDQGRLVSSMATVHYLAWAIPAIGFLGTVRGLAGSMTMAGRASDDLGIQEFLDQATKHLGVAFDCTLIALTLSLVVMFFLHSVQRDEEALVIDCQQYCLEHLVNRIYEPEALGVPPTVPNSSDGARLSPVSLAGSLTERMPR
jgi:biopolymer transport protein ExbB/TolQ